MELENEEDYHPEKMEEAMRKKKRRKLGGKII